MRNYQKENRTPSYEDCLKFIEERKHIHLFDFQKEIIKCFFEGKEVRTAHGIGRSMCANLLGEYIASLFANNCYQTEPEVIIPYQKALNCGLLSKEHIEIAKKYLIPDMFEKEYCSK